MGVKGIQFVNSASGRNLPGGEIITAPLDGTTQAVIHAPNVILLGNGTEMAAGSTWHIESGHVRNVSFANPSVVIELHLIKY